MLGQQFYHETMRKVIISFGTLFNNINLVRKNNTGNRNTNYESSTCIRAKTKVVI